MITKPTPDLLKLHVADAVAHIKKLRSSEEKDEFASWMALHYATLFLQSVLDDGVKEGIYVTVNSSKFGNPYTIRTVGSLVNSTYLSFSQTANDSTCWCCIDLSAIETLDVQ